VGVNIDLSGYSSVPVVSIEKVEEIVRGAYWEGASAAWWPYYKADWCRSQSKSKLELLLAQAKGEM